MSLSLTATTLAIGTGRTSWFLASGGTAPYTYSVVAGGAGGTINATTGQYTAPAVTGIDTIQVTDSASPTPATATLQILIGSALQLVCDIIQNQLGLNPGQVYLWNQKVTVPTDSQLYIAIGELSCKPFSNVNSQDGSGSGINSIQSTNFQATLSVDIFSRSTAALDRKEEVLMAFKSNYAESQMELNAFWLAPITTQIINISQIEGSAILYRFNLSVMLQYMVTKTVAVPYYSSFTKAITTNP